MIRSTTLIICCTLIGVLSDSHANAVDVVYRTLIAPSESVRFREINRLSKDPQRLTQHLDAVTEALLKHGKECTEERPPEASSVALCHLLGELETKASELALQTLLQSEYPEIAMLAVGQIGRKKYTDSIPLLNELVDRLEYREDYAYRFQVIRALIEMGHADASEILLRLRSDLDGQLRYHVDTYLEARSVDDFSGDQNRFKRFTDKLREPEVNESNAKLVTASGFFSADSDKPESLERMRLKPQQYYGIDIHAKRILFILDHSGSMKDPWYGMPRLDRAKGELIKAIRALSGDAEFGIVAFHTRVHQWNDGLVEATEANKDLAIEFVRSLGFGDRTNTYAALRSALDYDADLEAVYLLTDGKPTIGEIVAHQLILADILHRNRFRHLNLNTIGLAVDGFTREFLMRLAEDSGGEFRDAR